MSKLADGVLPLSSESATIPDRCLDQLPSNDIDAEGISKNSWPIPMCSRSITTAYRLRTRLKRPNGTGHYIGSQLPDSVDYEPGASKWGSLVNNRTGHCPCSGNLRLRISPQSSKVATHVAILTIAAANHKPAIPNEQHVLSEQDKKTNGQPKPSHSVLTATRQEVILAIQEPVQGTDVNRTLNQADAGDSIAQYEMALRYADGEGVPQNYPDAMAWFAKAAANGNDNAQWKLGLGYIEGIGVPHDERKAVVWFKRAANHGDIRAQSALSDLYLIGRGVPRDYVRAYTWASIATGLRGNDNDRSEDYRIANDSSPDRGCPSADIHLVGAPEPEVAQSGGIASSLVSIRRSICRVFMTDPLPEKAAPGRPPSRN